MTTKNNPMSDELSDEAYAKWEQGMQVPFEREAWRECRRRSEAQIVKERKEAFEEGWDARGRENYPTPSVDADKAYRAWREQQTK
jgi:hypothetical protein